MSSDVCCIERMYVWEEPLSFTDYPIICAMDDNPTICERVERIKSTALSSIPKEMTILGWEIVINTPTPQKIGSLAVRYLLFGKKEWFNGLDNTR